MTATYPGPGPAEPRLASDARAAPWGERFLYPEWGPIIAGAIAAAALGLVLHAFALAIGLSVSSTAPTWRDASFALVLLSGLISCWRPSPLTGSVAILPGSCACARLRRKTPTCATACMASWRGRSPPC